MELRPAAAPDLPGLHGVFQSAIGELFHRHGFVPPRPPLEAFVEQHAHLLEHDGSRFWVAEDAGELVGFSSAFERGDVWYLSALFVLPGRQARGVGRELLRRAWDGASPAVGRRLTIADSIQPVSLGLYGRAGLLPVAAALSLTGDPRVEEAPELEAGTPSGEELAALDRTGYGFDRSLDHAFWQRRARVTLWRREGEAVAYAYRWPGGRLGPLAGASQQAAAEALRAELARLAGRFVQLVVPSSAREVLAAALGAGLRAGDPAALVLASDARAPSSLALHGYSLF